MAFNLYEQRRRQRHNRLLVMLSILAILLTTSIVVVCLHSYIQDTKSERLHYAMGTVQILNSGFDTTKIGEYIRTGKVDDEYYVVKDILQNFADHLDYIKFLYVYDMNEDGATVIFDCDTPDLPGDEFGEFVEYDSELSKYKSEFVRGDNIPVVESRSSYGWLVTYCEPIYVDDSVSAYIFVDVAMDDIYSFSLVFALKIVIVSVVVMILCIAVGSWFSVTYHQKDDMEVMEKQHDQDNLIIRELTEAVAKIIDTKDTYTTGHSARVAMYTSKLAKYFNYDDATVEKYYRAALLHDIGKMGVPKKILNKEGRLDDEEFNIIKSHARKGYDILKHITVIPELALGAGYHHERPDGKGYPIEFAGQEIPRVAQLIAVADTFDAMYSDRPYRKRMKLDKILEILQEVKGTQLCPDVVDAFIDIINSGDINLSEDLDDASEENIDNIGGVKYVD